jgi:hypothetical protein
MGQLRTLLDSPLRPLRLNALFKFIAFHFLNPHSAVRNPQFHYLVKCRYLILCGWSASALRAAANLGREIGAVVSRGGRPDLAEQALGRVFAPVLLIVGGDDTHVLDLNRRA